MDCGISPAARRGRLEAIAGKPGGFRDFRPTRGPGAGDGDGGAGPGRSARGQEREPVAAGRLQASCPPSTEDWDRGGKFANYRTIGSVVDYLLVAQNRCHVELFHRASEGERWIFTETDGIDSTVDLASIEVRLELRQLYHKLEDLGWSR